MTTPTPTPRTDALEEKCKKDLLALTSYRKALRLCRQLESERNECEKIITTTKQQRDEWRECAKKIGKAVDEYLKAQSALGLVRLMTDDENDKEALEVAKKLPSKHECFKWILESKTQVESALAELERKETKT